MPFNLTKKELAIFRRLDSPREIQNFIDKFPIKYEKRGETYMSPRRVLKTKKMHCMEGAVLAAAALWLNGEEPLLLDLKIKPGGRGHLAEDHVVALYKRNGYWGAISKTNHATLRFRDPIYKNLRELALSYFEDYFNFDGEKTLRGFTGPIDLSGFDAQNWMSTEENLFAIDDELFRKRKKVLLFPGSCEKHFASVAPVAMRAGELWMREKGLFEKAKSK